MFTNVPVDGVVTSDILKDASKAVAKTISKPESSAGNSSALFLTAATQNLLCLKLAEELGVIIPSPWITWFKAASLPALVALLVTPLVLYKIYPPEIKDTPEGPAMATGRLKAMGPVTRNEWVMVGTMLLAVSLWVFGGYNMGVRLIDEFLAKSNVSRCVDFKETA